MRKLNDYCSDEFCSLYTDFGYSVNKPATLDEYTSYINLICNYLCKDFMEITETDAASYMSHMMSRFQEGKLSRKTICVRLSCYKTVARYIEDIDGTYRSAFEHIRRPGKSDDKINPKRIPSLEELDKFMGVVRDDPMYFLIYALATRVGLSASTILRIKEGDVSKEVVGDRIVFILRLPGKGLDEDRYISLPSDVGEIFENYLRVVTPVDGHIFFNQHKRQLTLKNLDSATEKFVAKSGINKYTMKDFRNRAVLELAKSGADLTTIKDYVGLSGMRISTLISQKDIISGKCPAELVNYTLRPVV